MLALAAAIAFAAPDSDPDGFQGQPLSTTSIRWSWNDNSSDEDGFELQEGTGVLVEDLGPGTETFDETGLDENTPYTRQVRGYTLGPGTETPDREQTGTTYSTNDYSYEVRRHGQSFTPSVSGLLTKVEFYGRNALKYWEPRIDVNEVKASADEEKLIVEVRYTVRSTNRQDNLVYPFYRAGAT